MAEITRCAVGGIKFQEELETVERFAKEETPLQTELLRHLAMLAQQTGVISACGISVAQAQNYLDSAVEAAAIGSWEGVRRSIESFRQSTRSYTS